MAEVGFGTKLEVKQGAGSYAELSDVLEITPSEITVKSAEYTPIKASSAYRRKLPATANAGPVTFKIVWTSTVETTLVGYLRDSTLTWKLTRSDGSHTQTFAGFISKIGNPISADEVDTIDIEITVDNAVTFG